MAWRFITIHIKVKTKEHTSPCCTPHKLKHLAKHNLSVPSISLCVSDQMVCAFGCRRSGVAVGCSMMPTTLEDSWSPLSLGPCDMKLQLWFLRQQMKKNCKIVFWAWVVLFLSQGLMERRRQLGTWGNQSTLLALGPSEVRAQLGKWRGSSCS